MRQFIDYKLIFYQEHSMSLFSQFLLVDLIKPHDKQSYCLKRNEMIIKQTSQSIKFDAICYSSQDIINKITLQLITLSRKSQNSPFSMSVTFNYNLQAKDLINLIESIITQKIYAKSTFRLGHFEIRNGHISDYNKNSSNRENRLIDDLDQFDKEIDNCLKLERLWKINEYLSYQQLKPMNLQSQVTKSCKKFGKRTNQFFVLEIDEYMRLVLLILPRSRDFVFTREQEKQIQQSFVLNKHSKGSKSQNICFTTQIAQIINNYLENSKTNILINSFPQSDRSLLQIMKLPIRLGNPSQQQISRILHSYNINKEDELDRQTEKLKKKFKETQYLVKSEQENMQKLIKIYSKIFNKSFNSIEYIKQKEVTDLHAYISWLKGEIKQKQQQIQSQQVSLNELHKQVIKDEQQHLFYLNKIKKFKQKLTIQSAKTTPSSEKQKQISFYNQKQNNVEPTQQQLMYLYDPQKELNRYRELKEQELNMKLNYSIQKKSLMKLIEEAKYKISKAEFSKLEQKFYDIISL